MHEELKVPRDIVDACREINNWQPGESDDAKRFHWLAMKLVMHINSALTAPQAETCKRCGGDGREVDYETGQSMTCPCTWQNQKPRPWTRKDGSTTPRGDVVDRRKTVNGNPDYQRRFNFHLGRRSGDAARWTAPVQETEQTLDNSVWVVVLPPNVPMWATASDTEQEAIDTYLACHTSGWKWEALAKKYGYRCAQMRVAELDRRSTMK